MGGVNVSRVIAHLGGQSTAIYAVGGPTGQAYRQLLEAEGSVGRAVPIAGSTRENITVDETETGKQFRFVLQGPELTEPEWRATLDATISAARYGGYVVPSGSLPPGVPDDYYAQVTRAAHGAGCRVVALTLGGDGAALATREGTLRLDALPIEVRSTVGAGDSFLAGMVLRLAEGRSLDEAFRTGVACGAATSMLEATDLCRADDVARLEAALAA